MTVAGTATRTRSGLLVENLSAGFDTRRGLLPVLDGVSLSVGPGRTLGIVGESGSGKTTLARCLMRHLSSNGRVLGGAMSMGGRDLLALSGRQLRQWRRTELAVVHQEGGATLDPSMRIGAQLAEVLRLQLVPAAEHERRILELLREVRLPDPGAVARRYPHELSGGQQQRVVIAAALATRPSLLILDEPTTGLDASVEAEILALLAELRDRLDAVVVLISHDLGLVGHLCDDVAVLYAGRVIEQGRAPAVLSSPRHPYTAALLNSAPTLGVPRSVRRLSAVAGAPPDALHRSRGCRFADRCRFVDSLCRAEEPAERLLAGRTVRCHYADHLELGADHLELGVDHLELGAGHPATPEVPTETPVEPGSPPPQTAGQPLAERLQLHGLTRWYGKSIVVDSIDLSIAPSEVFGLVGESGSGKTTLARSIMGIGPDGGSGTMALSGNALAPRLRNRSRLVRRQLQMVFQDPDATLNPSQRVRTVLARALATLQGKQDVDTLARRAQIDGGLLDASTATLSGGQKQRVAIARAFAGEPALVVCDEPVSALDVSVQAGILEVLAEERETAGTSYLFISHDLAVVSYLADRVGVMYRGELVEVGATSDTLAGPHHPYTAALVSAALRRPAGTVEEPGRLATGCRFADRCPHYLGEICSREHPELRQVGPELHTVRCHLPDDDLPRVRPAVDHPTHGTPTDPSIVAKPE